jgi:uncharacterized coiled-coil protein SlyX
LSSFGETLSLEARIQQLEERNQMMAETIERLKELVEGRNKSAPTKRNMTDMDAERVLVGEFKDMDHKEAAAGIGLTYAQVYSCRMMFTFKHVHKKLKDEGRKSPWTK